MPSIRPTPQARQQPEAIVILAPTDDSRWILAPRGRPRPPRVSPDEPLRIAIHRRNPARFRRRAWLQTSSLSPLEAALRQIPFAVALRDCLPG